MWWKWDTRPGSPLRTRTPARGRVGLQGVPGRDFCKDLPFFPESLVLSAQCFEFLSFSRGQAVVATSRISIRLLHPVADRLGGRLELTSQGLWGRPDRTNSIIRWRNAVEYGDEPWASWISPSQAVSYP